MPVRRVVTGLAMLVSGGLAIGGSFATLAQVMIGQRAETATGSHYTAWALTRVDTWGAKQVTEVHGPLLGIPLSVAAALALVAGAWLLVTLRRPAPGPRLLALAGGGALTAATATICLFAEGATSLRSVSGNVYVSTSYGPGMWLILAAGLIALVGTITALIRTGP